jgi:hypothetical protein
MRVDCCSVRHVHPNSQRPLATRGNPDLVKRFTTAGRPPAEAAAIMNKAEPTAAVPAAVGEIVVDFSLIPSAQAVPERRARPPLRPPTSPPPGAAT